MAFIASYPDAKIVLIHLLRCQIELPLIAQLKDLSQPLFNQIGKIDKHRRHSIVKDDCLDQKSNN